MNSITLAWGTRMPIALLLELTIEEVALQMGDYRFYQCPIAGH
jgi:hypothetical protein